MSLEALSVRFTFNGFGVLFLKGSHEPECVSEAKKALSTIENIDVLDLTTHYEASSIISTGWRGLIIFSISDPRDLRNSADFSKEQKDRIRSGGIRVCAFNELSDKRVEKALRKEGCVEILPFDINLKSFLHKIKLHLKSVTRSDQSAKDDDDGALLRNLDQEAFPESIVVKSKGKLASSAEGEIVHDDGFIFPTGESAFKKIGVSCNLNGLEIQVIETGDRTITVDIPNELAALGKALSVEIENATESGATRNVFAGKIKSFETEGDRSIAVLLLDDASIANLEGIQKAVEARQEEIISFFFLAKGE